MPASPLRPLVAGLAVTLAVAGCGSSDDDATTAPADDAAATTTAAEQATATEEQASTGAYRDGDYEAEGSYQSPGGTERVKVAVTLEGGTVASLTFTPEAKHPTSKQFQGKFASGIEAEVVGKPIDQLQVDKVSGSSLTSGGFNAAIERIKAEASS